jgi:hypothetical protein
MKIKVFNKRIMTPLKCGSTFLTSIYGDDYTEYGDHEINSYLRIEEVDTIIVRHPLSHLKVALHQELFGHIINDNVSDLSNEILRKYIDSFISMEYGIGRATHWSTFLYKRLFLYWKQNKQYTDVIDIQNLTEFLIKKTNKELIHNRNLYGFSIESTKHWKDNESLYEHISATFPAHHRELIKHLDDEIVFYNLLVNSKTTNSII